MFWGWIATNDLTVEGVHAGIIVFQKCTKTNELLCERMQYAGVSGQWSPLGWYVDYKTQDEHIRSEAAVKLAVHNPTRAYCLLDGDIASELLKRLLISLRLHPQSRTIFMCCVRLLQQLHDIHDMYDEEDILFQLWEDNPEVVSLLELEIRKAIKPNFKLMHPHLWNLNKPGFDIDAKPGKFPFAEKRAYTELNQYVERLCSTWDVWVLIEKKEYPIDMLWNEKWLNSRHRQINWFSLNHHVIQLLQLRQNMVTRIQIE